MTIPFILPGIKPSVVKLYRELCYFFPELTHFYGYAGTPDHNTKRCLDAMVYDSTGEYVAKQGRKNLSYSERIKLGDRVAAFLIKNAKHYHLNGIIWNRHVMGFPGAGETGNYRGPYATWRDYKLSAHDDHIHIDQDGRDFESLIPPTQFVWDGTSFPGADKFYLGAKGDYITYLGQRLVKHGFTGYKVGPGPEFSEVDQAGVKWAQEKQGFTGDDADGFPGATTWAWLQAPPAVVVPPTKPTKPTKPAETPSDKPQEPTEEPKPVSGQFTTVYSNILRRTDPVAGRKPWSARRANIIKHIQSGNPDVVLLVELDRTTASDVAKGLGASWSYWRFSGIGMCWDSSVFERQDGEVEHLYTDKNNRRLLSIPLLHKKSGQTVHFQVSHLENDGDPNSNGVLARKSETREWAAHTPTGKAVFGADLNSTTKSSGAGAKTPSEKPRVILKGAGWKFLTDQSNVKNREYASHHGGFSKVPKGAWIDDMGFKGLTFVSGELIRTDGDDASDHNMLKLVTKF